MGDIFELCKDDAGVAYVDRMQRNFKPMQWHVYAWRTRQLSDAVAKLAIYRAFVEGNFDLPRHLVRAVHEHHFDPQ